jgi:hypothetical protein
MAYVSTAPAVDKKGKPLQATLQRNPWTGALHMPYPWGIGLTPKIQQVVNKKKNRRLGCATCGPRRLGMARLRGLRGLGQDIYDPVTGTYGATLPTQDNPAAGTSAGSGIIPVLNNPMYSPVSATASIPTGPSAFTGPTASAFPSSTFPTFGVSVGGAAAAPSSGLSSYLPWLLLGVGGIALLATVSKRR